MIDPFFWFAAFLGAVIFLVMHLRDAAKADEEIRKLNRRLNDLEETEDDHYTSTACYHDIHKRCRRTCKFCDYECQCDCHEDENPRNFLRFLDSPCFDTIKRMR